MTDNLRGYFWPYDIFGYLLPGVVLLALLGKSNETAFELYGQYWSGAGWQNVLIIAGRAYVVGHLVAALSSWIIERQFFRRVFGWPTQRMFGLKVNRGRLSAGLYRSLSWIIPEYDRAYSATFQRHVSATINRKLGIEVDDFHDRFWLAWNYVALHHPPGFRRATHFLELYGFSRNLCMALLLAMPAPLFPGWIEILPPWIWASGLFVAALFFFSNYGKLIRRLNDEVYRALVSLDKRGREPQAEHPM